MYTLHCILRSNPYIPTVFILRFLSIVVVLIINQKHTVEFRHISISLIIQDSGIAAAPRAVLPESAHTRQQRTDLNSGETHLSCCLAEGKDLCGRT
jgi:hypothetical protein